MAEPASREQELQRRERFALAKDLYVHLVASTPTGTDPEQLVKRAFESATCFMNKADQYLGSR